MIKFIHLTKSNSDEIILNLHLITFMLPRNGWTDIFMNGTQYISVKETIDEIFEKIGE